MNLDTGKIRRQCHGWVDQVVGSSNAGVAHQVVDAVVDTVLHVMDTPTPEQNHGPTNLKPTPEDRAKLYANEPVVELLLTALEDRDTYDMRATMAEESCGALTESRDHWKEIATDASERADVAETRADGLQAIVDLARDYVREFDHLIGDSDYPERVALKNALGL